MNTTKPIKIPKLESVPEIWSENGRGTAYVAGFYAGYEQGAADHQPKIDPYAKTSLDNYDAQVVLFCKGHFDTILKELAPEMSEIDAIKLFISEHNAIDPEYINNGDVLNYLLINIIEPFVLPSNPRWIIQLIEDASPENSSKTGYQGGLTFYGQPGKIPYNYTEAMIFNLMSMISLTEVKYLPGLTAQANKEWFRREVIRKVEE